VCVVCVFGVYMCSCVCVCVCVCACVCVCTCVCVHVHARECVRLSLGNVLILLYSAYACACVCVRERKWQTYSWEYNIVPLWTSIEKKWQSLWKPDGATSTSRRCVLTIPSIHGML